MDNNYDIWQSPTEARDILSKTLKSGQLGLLLGAGVSFDLGIPGWETIAKRCYDKSNISDKIDIPLNPNTQILGDIMDDVKDCFTNEDEYLELVSNCLYDGIELDFETAKKTLLIAISSLIVGKSRGSVNKIINLNFDSFLEWYLMVQGLNVLCTSREAEVRGDSDVEIIHPHGFLPHPNMKGFSNSKKIVFTLREIKNREMALMDYWKMRLYDFFRSKIFLSIGVSPLSLYEYIRNYLSDLDNKYSECERNMPYGFSVIPTGEIDSYQKSKLLKSGIVVVEVNIENIPQFIFNIAQSASGFEIPSQL
nr:SIR2 family protein [uncultured Carboxylicivirga sp.]